MKDFILKNCEQSIILKPATLRLRIIKTCDCYELKLFVDDCYFSNIIAGKIAENFTAAFTWAGVTRTVAIKLTRQQLNNLKYGK